MERFYHDQTEHEESRTSVFTLCFVTLAWNVSDVFAQPIQDMVFEDDFSDGSTRWETTDSDSWTLTKQNGRAAGAQ